MMYKNVHNGIHVIGYVFQWAKSQGQKGGTTAPIVYCNIQDKQRSVIGCLRTPPSCGVSHPSLILARACSAHFHPLSARSGYILKMAFRVLPIFTPCLPGAAI